MKNYKLRLTTLSPVYIGAGDDKIISKKHCIYSLYDPEILIFDEKKLFSGLRQLNCLDQYEKFMLEENARLKTLGDFMSFYHIDKTVYKKWVAYTLPNFSVIKRSVSTYADDTGKGKIDNIYTFIKDAYGCPYIPGSSLKGALRTAIEGYAIRESSAEECGKYKRMLENAIQSGFHKNYEKFNSDISHSLFSKLVKKNPDNNSSENGNISDILKDVFSAVRISDSKPLSCEQLTLCNKIDVSPNDVKNTINVTRECLKVGVIAEFSLNIDDTQLKGSGFDFKPIFFYRALDSFSKRYKDYFLECFPSNKSDNNFVEKDIHLLYIGGGCGFGTKTIVNSLYDNDDDAFYATRDILAHTTPKKAAHEKDNEISPRMRKCTRIDSEGLHDFGLCKLTIEEV